MIAALLILTLMLPVFGIVILVELIEGSPLWWVLIQIMLVIILGFRECTRKQRRRR